MPPVNSSTNADKKQTVKKNKLHNRTTGITVRKSPPPAPLVGVVISTGKERINHIAKALENHIVDIEGLVPDPQNARLHGERNIEAIQQSLYQYGQRKPITVIKDTNTVIAGNGTLEAAKKLGWTKIAAIFHDDMTESEAIGFGIADNRTAELAKWDFKVLATLDSILTKQGHGMVGWSDDEVKVLRASDWTPTDTNTSNNGESKGKSQIAELKELAKKSLLYSFTPDQIEIIEKAVLKVRELNKGMPSLEDESECIKMICRQWLETREVN